MVLVHREVSLLDGVSISDGRVVRCPLVDEIGQPLAFFACGP